MSVESGQPQTSDEELEMRTTRWARARSGPHQLDGSSAAALWFGARAANQLSDSGSQLLFKLSPQQRLNGLALRIDQHNRGMEPRPQGIERCGTGFVVEVDDEDRQQPFKLLCDPVDDGLRCRSGASRVGGGEDQDGEPSRSQSHSIEFRK